MEVAKLYHPVLIALWVVYFVCSHGSTNNLGAAEAYGTTYVVGGDDGWSFINKTTGVPEDYASWASKFTFYVNDVLVFNYDPNAQNVYSFDNVEDWRTCNLSAAKLLDDGSSGSSQWYLPSEGYYDFASGMYCSKGQKFRIYAVNASSILGSNDTTATPPPLPPPSPSIPLLPPPLGLPNATLLPPLPPPLLPPSETQSPLAAPPSFASPPLLSPSSVPPLPGPPAPSIPSPITSPNPTTSDLSPSKNDDDTLVPNFSPSYIGSWPPALSPSTLSDGDRVIPYLSAYYLLGGLLTTATLLLVSH